MSVVRGLFDYFPDLDSVSVENASHWLAGRHNLEVLKNQFGNLILYPQIIPVTKEDSLFELALLREGLKSHAQKYYTPTFKKIYIPEDFLERFADLEKLVLAFIDAFSPPGITNLILGSKEAVIKDLGTVLKLDFPTGEGIVNIWVEGRKYQVKEGFLVSIPINKKKVDIRFESKTVQLLGKLNLMTEIVGGDVGIIVDARI